MNRDSLVELPLQLVHPGSLARGRYLLAIDGGATKTLAAVLDLHEHAVHLAEGGPSNEDAVGSKAAVAALLDVADSAMQRAEIDEAELATAVLAVAGTDTDAIARQVHAARSDEWIVVNDVVGAWAVATDARAWGVGGWGHLLGDEGSGYWLGVASIRAALADRDGSGPPTALSDAVVGFFDAPSVEALAAHVYSKPLTKGEIASFATETGRLADAGDAVACELYTRGAHELAGQILTVISHTSLGADGAEFPVGLIGSAYKAGAVFVDPLVAAVHQHAPSAQIETVELAPVGGGLQLAARACGCAEEIGPEELAQLIDAARVG
jgi:N-acetylglucosamine kinase-like BadF-type ATPase